MADPDNRWHGITVTLCGEFWHEGGPGCLPLTTKWNRASCDHLRTVTGQVEGLPTIDQTSEFPLVS